MYASPMAIVRTDSRSNIPAPPPSPIPTGSGSRSAANYFLSDYIDKSLNVPVLALPESQSLPTKRFDSDRMPDEIDLQSLVSRVPESVDRILESAREIGVFRIEVHGIEEEEELQSLEREAERVFMILQKRDTGRGGDIVGPKDNKEEIVWIRSGKDIMDRAREYIGPELYFSFSEKMECVGSKLDHIAEHVRQVFVESLAGKQCGKRSLRKQNVLSIYKYNHDVMHRNGSTLVKEKNKDCLDHFFSLHFPTKLCRYCVQSEQGIFSFIAGPKVIVVTVGKQLEEWSLGEYKCVFGEMLNQPALQADFCIELKCPCPSLNLGNSFIKRTHKTISVADQILIALIMAFLYHIFKFLWS